jgi:Dolichyl-phosphate-mannose-protein mannosyltransferase
MPIVAPPREANSAAHSSLFQRVRSAFSNYFKILGDISKPQLPWDSTTWVALVAIVAIWGTRFYTTWATWGSLTIDCGREMYVPAALAQGKTLYRDVWYMYGPVAPYFNAFLYRLFGIRLEVLYWAGSLSALASAILLFLIGKRMSSRLAGFTAAIVVLLQSFHAWHFSFPLPYSFAAVYGALIACMFLWSAIYAASSENNVWFFASACASAVALLLKLEYGIACYAVLALLMAGRALRRRSWKFLLTDALLALPGVLVSGGVIAWMVSIRGVEFMTQENIASWPTSYFMRTYGKAWMEKTGLALSAGAFGEALIRAIFFLGCVLVVYLIAWQKPRSKRTILIACVTGGALVSYGLLQHWPALTYFAALFFPRDMVLYVLILALCAVFLTKWFSAANDDLSILILFAFSTLLAFRVLLRMTPGGYPIYYNGPVILAFLLALRPLVPRGDIPRRVVLRAEVLFCLGCLSVVTIAAGRYVADTSDMTKLTTDRGSILVSNQVAANYKAAIAFMKERAAHGEVTLSIPEDVSLYFLSETDCPTRIYTFAPGIVAPGKMTSDVEREIESKHVRYLIWSNRTYPDYGAPVFGQDFNQELGDYLKAHYRMVREMVPNSDLDWQTKFVLWERVEPAEAKPL